MWGRHQAAPVVFEFVVRRPFVAAGFVLVVWIGAAWLLGLGVTPG
jgi:hypothetical protein